MRSASSGEQPLASRSHAWCRSASLRAMRSATSCEQPAWTSTSSRHSTTCCCTSERGPWPCGAADREAAMSQWYPTRRRVWSRSDSSLYATRMASEDQLLAAAAAAKPFAAAGEEVVGVLVADPFEHGLVFLCALGPAADDEDEGEDADEVPELGWIAVDPGGLALADSRRVQEAAMLAALCETAEEAALVPEAAEIAAAVDRALGLAGEERAELRSALEATREAALAAAVYDDGLRVARTGYVDQLGDAARALGASAHDLQQRGAELSASLSGQP